MICMLSLRTLLISACLQTWRSHAMHVGVRCRLTARRTPVERACFRRPSGTNQPLTSVSPPLGRPTCVPEAFLTRYGAICPGSQFRTASAALASGESQAWLLTATVSSTLATAALSASICTQRCFLPSHCSGPGRLFILPIHRDSDKLLGVVCNATLPLDLATGKPQRAEI